MGIIEASSLSDPRVATGLMLVGGFLPLLVGVVLPRLLGGWNDLRGKLFAGFSLGVIFSSFYDLIKETAGLSGSTLRTETDAINVLALSLVLLGFYGLHSKSGTNPVASLALVYLWALLGIGFHGFGEGIVAGYDFASGFTLLSLPQALSFALHKVGEGFTIGALLSITRTKRSHYLSTSILGGLPIAFGTVLGLVGLPGGTSTVFFASAAGATIFLALRFSLIAGGGTRLPVLGILLGFLFMYFSGVLHQFE